MIIAANFKASS